MKLFLRVYAECQSADVAAVLQEQIQARLAPWSPEAHAEPRQYWKMAEYFEFTFNLYPPTMQAHNSIRSLASDGWHDMGSGGELESVWNRGPHGAFLVPEAAWALLALNQ